MLILTAIILIILLIVIGILVVPFNIYLNAYNSGFKIKGTFKLTWMKLKLIQRDIPPEKPAEKKGNEQENEFKISNIPKVFSLLIESWPYFENIFNSFLRSTSFETFSLNLTLGLGDPADTALVGGYFWAVSSLLNMIPNAYISLEPDFLNERVEVDITLKIKIRLFWIIIEIIRAFTKKPVRMLFKELNNIRG
ncbi:DUF2953 domain-containing protein [Methanobacterium sp.]|uniref:DUF2953 domain-containing protein n=1 Tax=Methanobacterium sp. TaxID=2164 RepID=UPI003C70C510